MRFASGQVLKNLYESFFKMTLFEMSFEACGPEHAKRMAQRKQMQIGGMHFIFLCRTSAITNPRQQEGCMTNDTYGGMRHAEHTKHVTAGDSVNRPVRTIYEN